MRRQCAFLSNTENAILEPCRPDESFVTGQMGSLEGIDGRRRVPAKESVPTSSRESSVRWRPVAVSN